MSFQSREKKRRYKRAVNKAKKVYGQETAGRWFLTFARKKSSCAVCGRTLAAKSEIVYRHRPREIRCMRCAERLEDSRGYRPSLRWERARRRERERTQTRSLPVEVPPGGKPATGAVAGRGRP